MEKVINSKKNEINNLMNEIEYNLMKLDEEEYNSIIKDYNEKKESYIDLLKKINETSLTDVLLSLDTIYGTLKDFNDNICNNYSINNSVCYAN